MKRVVCGFLFGATINFLCAGLAHSGFENIDKPLIKKQINSSNRGATKKAAPPKININPNTENTIKFEVKVRSPNTSSGETTASTVPAPHNIITVPDWQGGQSKAKDRGQTELTDTGKVGENKDDDHTNSSHGEYMEPDEPTEPHKSHKSHGHPNEHKEPCSQYDPGSDEPICPQTENLGTYDDDDD